MCEADVQLGRTAPRFLMALFLVSITAALHVTAEPAGARETHPPGRFVRLLGHRIWVEVEGHGEPLILIPGGVGGSHGYYHPWFAPLAEQFQLVYYDGFGRGRSERAVRPSEYSFQHDVDEVEALRQALGFDKVAIWGHSYGGFVAQAYAVQHPDHLSHLILANVFPRLGPDYQASTDHLNHEIAAFFPETWDRIQRLRGEGRLASDPMIQKAYYGSFHSMLARFYFYDPARADSIEFSEDTFNALEYYEIAGPDADFVIGGDLRALDYSSRLAALRIPTLVIGGRADGIVLPAFIERFRRIIPRAQVVIFEHSGHFPFIEQQDEVLERLRHFLNGK